jgi:hypothetical protein
MASTSVNDIIYYLEKQVALNLQSEASSTKFAKWS